jgi:acyl carrier protein
MELEEIKSKLRKFIRERFNVSENDADFTDDVHLFDYGYIDSFGAVELTENVEKDFSITIKQSDFIVHPMNTVSEIAAFVKGRQEGVI